MLLQEERLLVPQKLSLLLREEHSQTPGGEPRAAVRGDDFDSADPARVPAHGFSVKVPSLPVIDDNNFMMLVEKALQG